MRVRGLIGAVALVAVLSACASGGSPMTTPSSARPPFQTTSPLPGQGGTASGSNEAVPPKRWAAILGDLSGRGVPTDVVDLVSAHSMTWATGRNWKSRGMAVTPRRRASRTPQWRRWVKPC